ncbi:MAG TPA: sigma-70 family RNA polymerase sigma factor [Terriglobia bacterium]|nr:sigma-70 family RNA polymerase sigma factor [Terriglobia bacterium]
MGTAIVEVAIPRPAGELERLFEEHHGLVFRTAYRITGNASDAEDVLQTVFLRLAGRGASTASLEDPSSYLRRASINAALDVVRGRRSGEELPADETLTGRSEPDRRELQDCLRRALARLSPREGEVFALRFLEGHSNSDIARLLHMSQIWVAVTVHRTRRRLQREIRSYLGGKS